MQRQTHHRHLCNRPTYMYTMFIWSAIMWLCGRVVVWWCGCWLLVAGCWLVVAGCRLGNVFGQCSVFIMLWWRTTEPVQTTTTTTTTTTTKTYTPSKPTKAFYLVVRWIGSGFSVLRFRHAAARMLGNAASKPGRAAPSAVAAPMYRYRRHSW